MLKGGKTLKLKSFTNRTIELSLMMMMIMTMTKTAQKTIKILGMISTITMTKASTILVPRTRKQLGALETSIRNLGTGTTKTSTKLK